MILQGVADVPGELSLDNAVLFRESEMPPHGRHRHSSARLLLVEDRRAQDLLQDRDATLVGFRDDLVSSQGRLETRSRHLQRLERLAAQDVSQVGGRDCFGF